MKKLSLLLAIVMCLNILCACANNSASKDADANTFSDVPDISFEHVTLAAGTDAVETDDIKGYISKNPWSESMNIQSLPVYENIGYTGYNASLLLSENEMLSLAEDVATLYLDSTVLSSVSHKFDMGIVTAPNSPVEESDIASVTVKTDVAQITVTSSANVTITFIEPKPLSEGYSLSTTDESAETAIETIIYLIDEYENIIGIEDLLPETKVWYADSFRAYLAFADGEDDLADVINYAFYRCEFIGDDTSLTSIKLNLSELYVDLLGNYSIIGSNEAKKMLTNGGYISDYKRDLTISENDIEAYELIYHTSIEDKYFMPYYRFYVKDADLAEIGKSVYKYYDVPAVKLEYFSTLPTWGGDYAPK